MTVAYLAPPERLQDLLAELRRRGAGPVEVRDRLVLDQGDPKRCAFAQSTWLDARTAAFSSIKEAADVLREHGRNWALHSVSSHRRAALISQRLPRFAPKPLPFPCELPPAPVGAWTLLDRDTLLFSAATDSPMALGEFHFEEDRLAPPSRAYLKLWEALTRAGRRPATGETCIDMGARPGGWTWAPARPGANVLSVAKAPLAATVAALPGVEFRAKSAFGLDPAEVGRIDWFFSDIVCYPARLLGLVRRWLEADAAASFVCTIKFQKETDFDTLDGFLSIEGSSAAHLFHNKHEVTWFLLRP